MKPRHLLMSASLAALLAGAATAQQTTEDTGTATIGGDASATATTDPGAAAPASEFTSLEEMTVGDVLDLSVLSPEGESIGDIDYVIDGADGPSAVVGVGGFLGLGEHTVAVPLADFEYDAEQRVLVLGTNKEALEAQPEFDETGVAGLPEDTPVATLMESDTDAGTAGTGDDAGMSDESATEEGAAAEGAADVDATSEGAEADVTGDATMSDDAEGEAAAEGGATDDAGATAEGSAEGSVTDDAGAAAGGAADVEGTEEGATDEVLEEETQSSDG